MGNLFNNTNCFFQQRIASLFASSDCSLKGTSLSNTIKNLVRFSTSSGDLWDVYTQNLRNYVGVYLTLNTNISAFYTTSNVSEMFDSFSIPAANVINNSGCSYIYSSVYSVYL